MKLLMNIFCLVALLITSPIYAFEVDNAALDKRLSDIKIEKKDVEAMVDKLVAEGKFSQEQGEKAKQELSKMSSQDMSELTGKAIQHVQKKSSVGAGSLDGFLEGINDSSD